MINAHKLETVLSENGTLILQGLPFQAGESVEVIILGKSSQIPSKPVLEDNSCPLKGSIIFYDEPFEPAVLLEDWEVLK